MLNYRIKLIIGGLILCDLVLVPVIGFPFKKYKQQEMILMLIGEKES